MFSIKKIILLFLIGGTLYYLLECVWRGNSHISMFFVGGICFVLLCQISKLNIPLALKAFTGCLSITLIELLSGIILNKMLHMNVWDYSSEPLNLMGQICPFYSFLWFLLSFAVTSVASLFITIP